MDRRAFISPLAGSLLAAPLAAEAQQASRVALGWLAPDARPLAIASFRQMLKELGWVEGQSLVIEQRYGRRQPIWRARRRARPAPDHPGRVSRRRSGRLGIRGQPLAPRGKPHWGGDHHRRPQSEAHTTPQGDGAEPDPARRARRRFGAGRGAGDLACHRERGPSRGPSAFS